MKTIKIIVAIIVTSVVSISSFGQIAGNVIYNNVSATKPKLLSLDAILRGSNYTEIEADVMINMEATSYTAIFSATQNGKNAVEADSFMNIRMNYVKKTLGQIGIKQEDIHVDVISIVPTYALQLEDKKFSKTANEIPTGIQMKKNIHVIFYEANLLDQIVSQVAKAEIYDIVKVDYNISNINKIYEQLRRAATQIVLDKGALYDDLGVHLEVQNLAETFGSSYPIERYESYTAYYTGSSVQEVKVAKKRKARANNIYVSGKKPKVTINNWAKEEDETKFIINHSEKNKTIYYNRIPYNQFDLVLNADFVEPRIQFYYTLKVSYSTTNKKNWEKQTEKELLSLTQKNKKKGLFKK